MTRLIVGSKGCGKDARLIHKLVYKLCVQVYGIGFIFMKPIAKRELLKDAYDFVYEMKDTFMKDSVEDGNELSN